MNSHSPPLTPQTGRPYRSKRHPPCDQCRQKKLRCETATQTACQRCQSSNTVCSFAHLHRSPTASTAISPEVTQIPAAEYQADSILPTIEPPHITPTPQSISYLHEPFTYQPAERPPLQQTIQTLDLLQGASSQVIGTSGESDPWLLRHCKFDDHGFLLFHQVHFRNAGGVPLQEKIPVHFLVTEDSLYESAKASTRRTQAARDELNTLIPIEYGHRLITLFLQHVFPSLPIVLHCIASETPQTIPVHLLAALYASALPFAQFDEYLSIIYAYTPPPTAQVWRLALDFILEEIHTPHLSVLQAGILYLHKPCETPQQAALADTPFTWSFVGMLVGLATCLGLQFECRPMGVPLWERRLRRRLWWAIYSEDKWRALLMGRPPYIRQDEWDVTDLDEGDFECPPSEKFMQFVRLSRFADDIQKSFYSLRAAQRLSSNFPDSLQTARTLLHSLKDCPLEKPTLPTDVHFAYLLLEIFIFRSLLRPMVRSATPPILFDESETTTTPIFPNLAVDDYIAQIIEAEALGGGDVTPVPAINVSDENGSGSVVLKAAENCAASVLKLVMRMEAREVGGFWYSWTRIGFATVSNFMLLLLVQAPSKDHAIRAKKLVYMWQQALQSQSKGWDMMDLGLVRLNGPCGMNGVQRSFYLPVHVREILP